MDKSKLGGHLAAAGAYAIFGFNIVFNKDIANSGAVAPMVLFTLRAVGATALFWVLSLFLPRVLYNRPTWKTVNKKSSKSICLLYRL